MNRFVQTAIQQPISVAVGVAVCLLGGILALTKVPVQMNPDVDSVVIAVSTQWENASAEEIESDIVEEQEKVLGSVPGLASITSNSQAGQGNIRLEFKTGTDIADAMAEVLQKLDEVPGYPNAVLQPVVLDIDPESTDYIAWIGLASTDPDFDGTTLYDFMERRLRPRFERLPGIAEVGIRAARASEVQIRIDPVALAQRGITYGQLIDALRTANANFSGGQLPDGKRNVRIRATGRFEDPQSVEDLIVRRDASGPIYLRDLAEVVDTYKESKNWARARGQTMPFFNYQLQRGSNLLETMDAIKAEVAAMNAPGGILEEHARQLGINGNFELVQTYDSTTYVRDAIDLVQSNIIIGGILATLTLLFFLRSLRTVGIIAIAIPISVIGAMVILVSLGRSINIISLAGMAFAVGMVVDNAIVVIENIFRHLEMGKKPLRASIDGTNEVAGAVVAATMTTLLVFIPILLIQETAGQLFKDIAYAIIASVGLSLIVSVTVIPTAAARVFKQKTAEASDKPSLFDRIFGNPVLRALARPLVPLRVLFERLPDYTADLVGKIITRWSLRLSVIFVFIFGTMVGIKLLLPPLDYLPLGNRNVVFGLLIPPPGYNLDQLLEMGKRIEDRVRPSWEAAGDRFALEEIERGAPNSGIDNRTKVPVFPPSPGGPAEVLPPPLDHYFLVSFDDRMFQVAISNDKKRVVDAIPLLNFAASGSATPDTLAFSFQFPLFQVGGNTGSAIKIDLTGNDLDQVTAATGALLGTLVQGFGPYATSPDPPNFSLPMNELRIVPDDSRLRELGMTRSDVGLAVQANGDGILLFRQFERNGELKDLKVISQRALGDQPLEAILATPIATPSGKIVDLQSVAKIERVFGPNEIKHVDRRRAVTLQLTPPAGMPLESAIDQVNTMVGQLRKSGAIPPGIDVKLAGSAGKLSEIKNALLGDGTLIGTASSTLFLAFVVVYLVLVVLFQSWSYPLVIMLSVPLATFGGFLGLALLHTWSVNDRYMPVQNLDMLTILGFVILAGVVVNNAILIVHQALNFLRDDPARTMTPQMAIQESVRSRVRPILMSSLTSVGGMLPLVLIPGSGSELYRGLGSVVTGGLLISTVFTLVLVPAVLSVVFSVAGDPRDKLAESDEQEGAAQ
ncbi:MAG: HAE1 family hydrophobic/amphiphilic exporter-1 [Verrucomicrobiales bacterium]|jgi:HAE1 family hydrophobic/amphiphilic exporter-1